MVKKQATDNDILLADNTVQYGLENASTSDEIQDKGNIIYICFILLGAGLLFPYNCLITATDYLDATWPDRNAAFLAPLMCNVLSPILQIIMLNFSHLITYRLRSVAGFSAYTAAVVAIPVVGYAISNKSLSFVIGISLMATVGAINAILSGTIFGIGAALPAKYSQAIMAGNGWSGVAVCVIRILTKLIFERNIIHTSDPASASAYTFFGASALVCLLCIFAYLIATSSPFTQQFFNENNLKIEEQRIAQEHISFAQAQHDLDAIPHGELILEDSFEVAKDNRNLLDVLSHIWPNLLNIALVFIMTFLVFPGLCLSTKSTLSWVDDSWLAVVCVTIFNIFDLIGRSMPAYYVAFTKDTLIYGVLVRFLLYSPFLLIGAGETPVIQSTWVLFFLIVLLALSNGYVSTCCFILSGDFIPENYRALGGSMMSLFLAIGITSGSFLAMGVNQILS